jgi:hypothetical protein
MSEDEAESIAAEAAEDFKRQVEQAGTVRMAASDLMAAFGLTDMGQESRESVADALWEAGVCAEPSLAGERIDTSTKISRLPRSPEDLLSRGLIWHHPWTPSAMAAQRHRRSASLGPIHPAPRPPVDPPFCQPITPSSPRASPMFVPPVEGTSCRPTGNRPQHEAYPVDKRRLVARWHIPRQNTDTDRPIVFRWTCRRNRFQANGNDAQTVMEEGSAIVFLDALYSRERVRRHARAIGARIVRDHLERTAEGRCRPLRRRTIWQGHSAADHRHSDH